MSLLKCKDEMLDAPVEDKMAVKIILASLDEEYDGPITALEAWDEDKLTIHTLKKKLLEEFDRKTAGTSGHEHQGDRFNAAKCTQETECYVCKKRVTLSVNA
ncbi:hypothetical protein ACKWTF_012502 [Chironomus riparius]